MGLTYYNSLLLSALLLLFVLPNNSLAKLSPKPKALVLSVTKDPSTLQFLVRINSRTPLVPVKLTLDLGGQYPRVDCEKGYVSSSYKPGPCESAQCKLARAGSCVTECLSNPKPGCNNNTCALLLDNTVTRNFSISTSPPMPRRRDVESFPCLD